MARTKGSTKSTIVDERAVISNSPVDDTDIVDKKNTSKSIQTTKKKIVESLVDTDEIEIISLIPNVSYLDNRNNDYYEWENVGHSEFLTYEVLKNMWRNSKSYFKNLWLKPLDERVINKFGLTKNYDKYEFLMDEKNYTKDNITTICQEIEITPSGLKYSIYNKIKDMVANGKITDISVIMKLEKSFNLDLTSILL